MKHAIEQDDYNDNAYDALLSAELRLPNNATGGFVQGTVIKRLKNNTRQPIGTQHADANLDTLPPGESNKRVINFIYSHSFYN